MDLPTYTNIWRIEKRLYKLYDFRLPMPVPVGQIAVYAAIAVPYAVALSVLGLPFSHTLLWLYVLPPGALAWLVTRPVLESKRLPELVISQLRYLSEPRTWCRMAPLAEKDEVAVTVRIWRQGRPEPATVAEQSAVPAQAPAAPAVPAVPALSPAAAGQAEVPAESPADPALPRPAAAGRAAAAPPGRPAAAAGRHRAPVVWPAGPGMTRPAAKAAPAADRGPVPAPRVAPSRLPVVPAQHTAVPAADRGPVPAPRVAPSRLPVVPAQHIAVPVLPAAATRPPAAATRPPLGAAASAQAGPSAGPALPARQPEAARQPEVPLQLHVAGQSERAGPPEVAGRPLAPPARQPQAQPGPPEHAGPAAEPPDAAAAGRPVVTVTGGPAPGRPLRVVERALNGSPPRRADGWRDHVVVVPGGHRPGRPDPQQRDRARARLPVSGSRRIVVLGCTVGAGQTMTTLMTGEVLASLRSDQVAVLDLNPGSGSLADRARAVPTVPRDAAAGRGGGSAGDCGEPSPSSRLGPSSRLEVISRTVAGTTTPPADEDVGRMFELVSARYPLTLADPAASAVPRVLAVADQLVLVAPASADAASAIAMTYEWLEAHGRAALAAAAITVLNGVSRHTMRHVEQAETVASGRCRAIVRVPWDDLLRNPALLRADPSNDAAESPRPPGGALSTTAANAYTALAGVLIAGLADAPEVRGAQL